MIGHRMDMPGQAPGECDRCNDDGDGGVCTCCGVLHSPRVILRPCLRCGGPAEMPGDDYCNQWPNCENPYDWRGRTAQQGAPSA